MNTRYSISRAFTNRALTWIAMAAVALSLTSLACAEQSGGGSEGGADYYSGTQLEWEPEDVSSLEVVHLDLVRPPWFRNTTRSRRRTPDS